jgi:hypothetical protein
MTFKPEYINKLGSDKERFINNLKKSDRWHKVYINQLNASGSFFEFCLNAFLWTESIEAYEYQEQGFKNWRDKGKDYWFNIANRK